MVSPLDRTPLRGADRLKRLKTIPNLFLLCKDILKASDKPKYSVAFDVKDRFQSMGRFLIARPKSLN